MQVFISGWNVGTRAFYGGIQPVTEEELTKIIVRVAQKILGNPHLKTSRGLLDSLLSYRKNLLNSKLIPKEEIVELLIICQCVLKKRVSNEGKEDKGYSLEYFRKIGKIVKSLLGAMEAKNFLKSGICLKNLYIILKEANLIVHNSSR